MTDEQITEIAELQDKLICKGGPKKGKPNVYADENPAELDRLRELLDEQAAETDDPTPEPVVVTPEITKPKPFKLGKPAAAKEECSQEAITLEREIRRYVKKSGGFRVDISDEAKAEGNRLLKMAGRKKPEWNERIQVPGYDR